MHAVCVGAISFGLVTIPVKLYAATRDVGPHFRQLHATCGARIESIRRCPICKRDVPPEEITPGHEVARDEYVPLSKEELEAAAGEDPAGTVDVVEMVAPSDVDLSLVDKSYWVAPSGPGARPFALLRECLTASGRVGIAKTKIRRRVRMAMLRPREKLMSLALLRFAEEVVTADGLPAPAAPEIGDRERELALSLIERLYARYEPSKHPDEYRRSIEAVVERRLRQGTPQPGTAASEPVKVGSAQVVDLSDLLSKSLRAVGQPRLAKAPAKRGPQTAAKKNGKP
jgi:DNA end-binding protein Ku